MKTNYYSSWSKVCFRFVVMGYGLSVEGYGLSVVGYGLSVMGYGLSVMGYGLSVMGYGLSVMGYASGLSTCHLPTAGKLVTRHLSLIPFPLSLIPCHYFYPIFLNIPNCNPRISASPRNLPIQE
jgi:hypothetical protein